MAVLVAVSATAGKRVLFIGDSITDGAWGYSQGSGLASKDRNHTDMNHIYGHSYMMLCASHYQSLYPDSDFVFYNRGISGNTLDDLEKRWQEDCLDLKPDVVSILIGTNDVGHYLNQKKDNPNLTFDVKAWKAKYRDLIEKLKASNRNVKIVILAPFVAKEGWVGKEDRYPERLELVTRCADAAHELADGYHVPYLPYNTMFDKLIQTEPRPSYWIWDGIHPTPAGHRRMADMWIATVDRWAYLIH